jgi:hypothetical protein
MARGFLFFLGLAAALAAGCGDDAASSSSKRISKAGAAGEGGEGGDSGSGGDSGTGGTGGSFPGGGSGGDSGSGGDGGTGGASCLAPPPLPACSEATDCLACLCDKCADAWSECMADDGCKLAVACVREGCSLSQCAGLTTGEASLARAEAVDDCRASKQKCRTECSGGFGGSAGAGGSDPAGAGGSGPAGAGGEAGQGGAAGAGKPLCCTISDKSGCDGLPAGLSAEQQAVQDCVCAKDSFCCNNAWDDVCVGLVGSEGCGPACPGGGGAGGAGAGGIAGASGASGAGVGGSAGASGGSAGSAGAGGKECVGGCEAGKVCDTNTGLCEDCVSASDCKDNYYGPLCLGTSGVTSLSCGCSSNFDCKNHPGGPLCESFSNVCTCTNSNECTSSPFGKKCVKLEDFFKGKIDQCGCEVDTDCPAGKKCIFNACAE